MDVHSLRVIFEMLGGLGIFLYGIKTMRYGLQKSNGQKLKLILDQATTNPFKAVLVGLFVTSIIQSSSATSVITIGLVSTGLLTLKQAIGVIVGANIGTTVTAFMIGLNIGEYGLPIIAIGACFVFFVKNTKPVHMVGQIIFGVGAIFYGLELMGTAVKPLTIIDGFDNLSIYLDDLPIIGVLLGTVTTIIIQSSSATIGILQELHAESIISLNASIPIIFGDNIGTTITAVIASIGSSVAAKRTAASHVFINVISAVIFMFLLQPFIDLMISLKALLKLNPEMTLAFAHGIFNFSAILFVPFIGIIVMIVTKLVPEKDPDFKQRLALMDPIFIEQSPSIALGLAKEEIVRMGNLAIKGLEDSYQFIQTKDSNYSDQVKEIEEALNDLHFQITNYLIEVSSPLLSKQESKKLNKLMENVKIIENIGDHALHLIELREYQIATNSQTDHSSSEKFMEMFQITIDTVKSSMVAFDQNDKDLTKDVQGKENTIHLMERKIRKQYMLRAETGTSSLTSEIIFIEYIGHLERIGDLALQLANTNKDGSPEDHEFIAN